MKMNMKEQNILFFTRTMGLGGTENVILQLCEILGPLVNNIVVCSCGGVNEKQLHEMGIKHYTIPDMERKDVKTMISIGKNIKKIVKKEEITIIHTHHRMAAFYVSLLRLYKTCKFLNTAHNTFENKKILTRFAYKHAYLVACGEMVKKNLEKVFGLSDVVVVHNAVSAFDWRIKKDDLIERLHDDGKYVIGNVGRLSEQKGMEYYIKAIPSVIKKHPETSFLIVGTGEDENKLKELSKKLDIETSVFFMGYRNDIQNIMFQMDLIVLSSLWEGFPLTPIEAFSVGKTIVATAVDGTIEIVSHEENGLLIAEKSPEQISDKIIWMIEHSEEKKNMEKIAYETYNREFSVDKLAEGYLSCYKNA